MSSNLMKALGVGAAVALLSAGSAFAAVATGSVNVRTGPGTWYSKVDTLFRGEQVAISDRSGGWCFVEKSGPDGWVSCRFLTNGGVVYRTPQTSVRLSIGFGAAPRAPMHRHHDWTDDGGYWSGPDGYDDGGHWSGPDGYDDGGYWSGPRSVTTYPGGSFSIY